MSVGAIALCSLAALISAFAWWRERTHGAPPPSRPWLRPALSPLFLLPAGMLLGVVLVVTTLISLGLGFDTVPDALAYPAMVVGFAPFAAVGYACARWWQPPYLLVLCWLLALVVGIDPADEATSVDDALVVASGIAVIVGVGVVVRELVWAASQRRRERLAG